MKIITVGLDQADYSTISDALDAAEAGDTIMIGAGDYPIDPMGIIATIKKSRDYVNKLIEGNQN